MQGALARLQHEVYRLRLIHIFDLTPEGIAFPVHRFIFRETVLVRSGNDPHTAVLLVAAVERQPDCNNVIKMVGPALPVS
ncbi:hypothetical protein D3C71_2097980 [compost metagenome]